MAIKGMKAHAARLRALGGGSLEYQVGKALFAAGEAIQVEAQIGITTGSVSGKYHVPSAAGGYPNQDTGTLANNIETVQKKPLLVEVSSNAPYSSALEFGTSKMAARPFMTLARNAKLKEAQALVVQAVKRAAKQARR